MTNPIPAGADPVWQPAFIDQDDLDWGWFDDSYKVGDVIKERPDWPLCDELTDCPLRSIGWIGLHNPIDHEYFPPGMEPVWQPIFVHDVVSTSCRLPGSPVIDLLALDRRWTLHPNAYEWRSTNPMLYTRLNLHASSMRANLG